MDSKVDQHRVRISWWPAPQDYNEAVQLLEFCATDADLRQSKLACDSNGLPRPITGMFASVYRLQCPDRELALRCFLRNVPDQQFRYQRIEEHLRNTDLDRSYFLPFTTLEHGIQIDETWFPVLKMQWCTGTTLDSFIEQVIAEEPKSDAELQAAQSKLSELAEQWKIMMLELRSLGIAHGDLQHANVLVERGQLKLVDYDGMFVPALSGLRSTELGHQNYQHPMRSTEDFDESIDVFSGWLIYASLKCLSLDPSLWHGHGAKEYLLWQHEDLLKPYTSALFECLDAHADSQIRYYSRCIRYLLQLPVADMPPLGVELQLPEHVGPTLENLSQEVDSNDLQSGPQQDLLRNPLKKDRATKLLLPLIPIIFLAAICLLLRLAEQAPPAVDRCTHSSNCPVHSIHHTYPSNNSPFAH